MKECSTCVQKKLPTKLKDLGRFTISCCRHQIFSKNFVDFYCIFILYYWLSNHFYFGDYFVGKRRKENENSRGFFGFKPNQNPNQNPPKFQTKTQGKTQQKSRKERKEKDPPAHFFVFQKKNICSFMLHAHDLLLQFFSKP